MKYIMTPKRLEIIALLALFASGIAILVLGVYLIIWLGDIDMEFRNVTVGYDLEAGFYFVIGSEQRVVAEARS